MPLRFKLQLVVVADDGVTATEDLIFLDKEHERLEQLGLTLAEGKQLLREVQRRVLERQVKTFLATQAVCPDCGRERGTKDHKTLGLRTLFGKVTLESPRLRRCCRQPGERASISPLSRLLSERSTPELQSLEARWASLVSYGLTVRALQDFLPVDEHLSVSMVRRTTLGVARRCEAALGPEQPMFIDGCRAEWDELPRPDLPLTVGLDGGYVHASQQRSRRDGWFEVIAGKSMPAEGPAKCFGFVQTYDPKPKRRLFEVLKSQGMQPNQQVTFLTDGGEDIRDLPRYLNPQAEHLLDWFHVAMRLTVMGQFAKSLPTASTAASVLSSSAARATDDLPEAETDDEDAEVEDVEEESRFVVTRAAAARELERLKWFLWHGNVFRALQVVQELEVDLDTDGAGPEQRKLLKAVTEFGGYMRANASCIPNYGERYRSGEAISSAFVESTVNQVVSKRMVKKQQMRWTPEGAHLLLQTRTRTLNGELATTFRSWYPAFSLEDEAVAEELPSAA